MPLKTPAAFPYCKKNVRKKVDRVRNPGYLCDVHTFSFYTEPKTIAGKRIKAQRYLLEIEEYEHQICAVKFFRACDKSKGDIKKYQVLAGNGCVHRILATAVAITYHFLSENPHASFSFWDIGQPGENEQETRRFRVYRQLVINYLSPGTFDISVYKNKSILILLNKHNPHPNLMLKIEHFFKNVLSF